MRERFKRLMIVTLAGVAVGVCGDLFLSPDDMGASYIVWGILLSPLSVTAGGRAVSIEGWESMFLLGGLLFWPVYLVLAAVWLRYAKWPVLVGVVVWTAQGFFQVGLRMALISSA